MSRRFLQFSYLMRPLSLQFFSENCIVFIWSKYSSVLDSQLYRLHMSEEFFNSSMTIVSSSYEWSKYSSVLDWQLNRLHMSEKLLNSSLTIVSSSIKRKTTNQRNQMNPLHCVLHVSNTCFIKFRYTTLASLKASFLAYLNMRLSEKLESMLLFSVTIKQLHL